MAETSESKLVDRKPAAAKPLLPGGMLAWLICVLVSALPLALFLLAIEIFTSGTVVMGGVLDAKTWGDAALLSPVAKSYASVAFFSYGVYNFIHLLICLCAGLFFLSELSTVAAGRIKALICLLLAAMVTISIYDLVTTTSAFRGYTVAPLQTLLTLALVAAPRLGADIPTFLIFALVIPTSLGIIVVLLASGSFHATLFFARKSVTKTPTTLSEEMADRLRRGLIAASIVLVSSVMTARAYFTLPAKLFADADSGPAKFYAELAQSLSTGAGLLFSATLLAAFVPGFLALLARDRDDETGESNGFWPSLSANATLFSSRFKGAWKSLVALIAPALSAPLLDLIAGLLG